MKVYLDNAATTPLDPEVFEAMRPIMLSHFGNPSSIHSHGREVRAYVERSRKLVSDLLQTSPSEIFFTSGGTEADNTVLRGCVNNLGVNHIITSKIEHHAILHTLESLAKTNKVTISFVSLDDHGNIDVDHLEELLKPNGTKKMVSLMHANNEIGNLIDLYEIGNLCHSNGALFHSDTVQAIGHLRHDLSSLPVDFIVGSAHKFNGPKGVGFLYINHNNKLNPLIYGGGQERNMRSGTENVYGIIGLAKALELIYQNIDDEKKYIECLKQKLIDGLKAIIPDIKFNGSSANFERSLYTILNVAIPPQAYNEMFLFNLDINGISASGGSACTSGSSIGSHVIAELHQAPDWGTVRFSFSKFNTNEEIDYVLNKLKEISSVSV